MKKKHTTDLVIMRKELKYSISYNQYIIVSNLLKRIMKPDKHNAGGKAGYFIRNLYFDTIDNKTFEEKMAGLEERAKYRLRIYDLNSKWAKFEIKKKFNDMVVKETAIITRKDAIEVQKGNYDILLKYDDQVLNNIYKEFKMSAYHPVVLISYWREAYTFDSNNIRIVFDRFLKSSSVHLDLFKKEPFSTAKIKKGIVVLEIKYTGFMPKFFKKILQQLSASRIAISKYCIGRLDEFEGII